MDYCDEILSCRNINAVHKISFMFYFAIIGIIIALSLNVKYGPFDLDRYCRKLSREWEVNILKIFIIGLVKQVIDAICTSWMIIFVIKIITMRKYVFCSGLHTYIVMLIVAITC